MPGDYSRFTDDPRKRFSRVLLEQGRVIQDADLNEMVEILTRRDRLHVLDIMGPAAVPRLTTPTGFAIAHNGVGDLKIGAGRAYVDGIVAETMPGDVLTYLHQPFYPDPPALNTVPGGAGLVYLDVWEREITNLEDPTLPDPALGGIDTSTRTQTVWQVKVKDSANCGANFKTLFPPSAGRLSVKLDQPPDPPDPCLLPESAGLRDVENRFYRLEVHGGSTPVKFKFSHDPVATRVTKIPAAVMGKTTIEVERIGLDSVLRFSQGDWVEVTNDRAVLRGEPGQMAFIEHIDEAALQIRLDRAIPQSWLNTQYPPRLIRWDQKASAGVPLDADGLITATGAWQELEAGIKVQLTLDPNNGKCHHGDVWRFPSRVATQLVGPLTNEPPREIVHHYCALSTVSGLASNNAPPVIGSDCRNLWPPFGVGDDCECTVCVTPEEHNSGKKTIQQAIFQAKAKGGGKVCLKPGIYVVRQTIEIQSTSSLSLTGHGNAIIYYLGSGPTVHIEQCSDVTVEELYFLRFVAESDKSEPVIITIENCVLDTAVQDCVLSIYSPQQPGNQAGTTRGIGIGLRGVVGSPHIVRNVISAGAGIGNAPPPPPPPPPPGPILGGGGTLSANTIVNAARFDETATPDTARAFFATDAAAAIAVLALGVDVRENVLLCGHTCVALLGYGISMDVKQNWMVGGRFGVALYGTAYPGGAITINDNNIFTYGAGVSFTTSVTSILNNSITSLVPPNPDNKETPAVRSLASGILAGSPIRQLAPEHVKIIGNRIAFFCGNGIYFTAHVGSAMVKQNSIAALGGGAVVGAREAHVERLFVANNDIGAIGLVPDMALLPPSGVHLFGAGDVDIVDNDIHLVMQPQNFPARGVYLVAPRHARIYGNSIAGIRPSFVPSPSAGIEMAGAYATAQIANNKIVWRQGEDANAGAGRWIAVLIGKSIDPKLFVSFRFADAAINRPEAIDVGGWMYMNLSSGSANVAGAVGAVILKSSEQALLVRGNIMQINSATDLPVATIDTTGTLTFGENDCRAARPGPSIGTMLKAETAIVDSNHVIGATKQAMEIAATGTLWTVLGNIVQGSSPAITVNGAPLSGLWLEANRQF